MAAGIRNLPPAYFALVMATGIVSLAVNLFGMRPLAVALFAVNAVAYLVLWSLTVARLAAYRADVLRDLGDHVRGPGFFTIVAATCVIAVQLLTLFGQVTLALALWGIGVFVWCLLTYSVFAALTVKEPKPALEAGISGAWLLAVVATQAIVVLTTSLEPYLGAWSQPALFFALSMWLWGGMLYIWMISLIFYRYTFFTFLPHDLTPPYWINMGAMAISALGGADLLLHASRDPLLGGLVPFITGFTIFFWATGTWWLPMLIILAVWRHVFRRFPVRYDPLYWGAVFPIGMYTVATHEMARVIGLGFLDALPRVLVFVSLLCWALAFLGLLGSVQRGLFVRGVRTPASETERA